ncbi:amino-acid permease inda1 [Fusarium oxysporum]|nr:amino-acid permease inda1 [Fusarium oxysporum]
MPQVQKPKITKAEAQSTPALEVVESNRQGILDDPNGSTHRGLKSRHIQLIALGGTIGTGLFVGSGATLAQNGPAPLLMSYIVMSILVWGVMLALGEMTSYMPIKALTMPYLVNRFVDTSLAFATVSSAVWITIILVVILLLNIIAVALFGESEFWFASIKIIAFIGLIFLSIILFFGGGPNHNRLGFKYWKDPGVFREYLVPGNTGKFLAFWNAMIKAGFSYILSPELITTTAGECQAPRRNIPKATSHYIYRLVTFYVLGALVIGVVVPWSDPRLLGSSNASASPFVIGIQNASIPVLNHILNAVILTSAWSSGNSMLYAGSRMLYGMACKGDAPSVFKCCNRYGVPYAAVLATFGLGLLAYLNVSTRGADVFNWLTTNIVLFTYLRFRKAIFRNGIKDKLPYKAVLQPYLTYFSILGMSLVCLTNGFAVFFPGNFKVATFITSYISFPLFLAIYLGHKLFYGKRAWIRPASDLDVFGELEEVEEITVNDVPPVPRNFLEKVWLWIC